MTDQRIGWLTPKRAQFGRSGRRCAQSNLICAPQPVIAEESPAAQNGGFARSAVSELTTLRDRCQAQAWQCLRATRTRDAIRGRDTA
jgi:hypothetical protein